MIGHVVGVGVQFITESTCKLAFGQARICSIAGVFVHEFIAEPFVNSMLMNGIYEHNNYNIKQCAAGAVGAVIFSQTIEYFIEDANIIISSSASLAGSAVGGGVYEMLL